MQFILLVSAEQDQRITRAFYEFETRDEIAQMMIEFFEDYLNAAKENLEEIEYDTDQMFEYMDRSFGELVVLVRDDRNDLWVPYATSWIKEAIYLSLKKSCENLIPSEKSTSVMMDFELTTSS